MQIFSWIQQICIQMTILPDLIGHLLVGLVHLLG